MAAPHQLRPRNRWHTCRLSDLSYISSEPLNPQMETSSQARSIPTRGHNQLIDQKIAIKCQWEGLLEQCSLELRQQTLGSCCKSPGIVNRFLGVMCWGGKPSPTPEGLASCKSIAQAQKTMCLAMKKVTRSCYGDEEKGEAFPTPHIPLPTPCCKTPPGQVQEPCPSFA